MQKAYLIMACLDDYDVYPNIICLVATKELAEKRCAFLREKHMEASTQRYHDLAVTYKKEPYYLDLNEYLETHVPYYMVHEMQIEEE